MNDNLSEDEFVPADIREEYQDKVACLGRLDDDMLEVSDGTFIDIEDCHSNGFLDSYDDDEEETFEF